MAADGNDKCVCCGRDSGVAHNTPIDKRKYYISGSGQLCCNCYYALYVHNTEDKGQFSDEEMYALLRLCRKNNP